jgi:hypothetical protein
VQQEYPACSLGLSATSQQYFSLRTNQPPAPAISHQPTEQADGFFTDLLVFTPFLEVIFVF